MLWIMEDTSAKLIRMNIGSQHTNGHIVFLPGTSQGEKKIKMSWIINPGHCINLICLLNILNNEKITIAPPYPVSCL